MSKITKEVVDSFYYKDGCLYRKKDNKKIGTKAGAGYLYTYTNGSVFSIHRIIYTMHNPDFDQSLSIDHIDGNPLNNKIENLRAVTHKQNLRNQKLRNTNTSGVMGVYKHGDDSWTARIKVDGVFMYLGLFKDFNEAVKVRKQAEVDYGFHTNHGNV